MGFTMQMEEPTHSLTIQVISTVDHVYASPRRRQRGPYRPPAWKRPPIEALGTPRKPSDSEDVLSQAA